VFNSNTAQELSPGYVADRRGNNEATLDPARIYVRERFRRELDGVKKSDEGPRTIVLFTAGGQGSGKSSSIARQIADAEKAGRKLLVFDTTLQDKTADEQLIRSAIDSGAIVGVSYIHNPVENAMRRNIGRGKRNQGNN
jgi:signal recognition particle GTPase